LSGAAAAGATLIVKPTLAAEYKFSQYHNQAASGTLHKNLTAMWQAVSAETNGRVETTFTLRTTSCRAAIPMR
jgi:TRAP-type C4-dicarboxylate transport system substrate-binding protein